MIYILLKIYAAVPYILNAEYSIVSKSKTKRINERKTTWNTNINKIM